MDVVRRIVMCVSLGVHLRPHHGIPDPGTFFSALPTFNCRSITLLPFLLVHHKMVLMQDPVCDLKIETSWVSAQYI